MERPLNPSKVDSMFFEDVIKSYMGRTSPYCFECAACSYSCPVAENMDVKPHQMVKMMKLGLKDTLIRCKAIWQCVTCYMCTERCPQRVNLTEVLTLIKNLAARDGKTPDGIRRLLQNILTFGQIDELGEFENTEREEMGLPPAVKVNVEDIQKLLHKTGFGSIIGFK